MKKSTPPSAPHFQKETRLEAIGRKLELPIQFLSFAWFLVLITELVNGTSPILHILGSGIWILYILYFILKLIIGPSPRSIAKKNWLFILAMIVSTLRFTPFFQDLALVRVLTATFGMQAIWIVTSAHQGLRSVGRTMGKKGIGYALVFTSTVVFAGAAGMLYFEKDLPGSQGIHNYPTALWWSAMQITNIGSGYSPITPGGKFICLGISIYAAIIFGYLTAILATYFVGREVKEPPIPMASLKSMQDLQQEVMLLRKSIEKVLLKKNT